MRQYFFFFYSYYRDFFWGSFSILLTLLKSELSSCQNGQVIENHFSCCSERIVVVDYLFVSVVSDYSSAWWMTLPLQLNGTFSKFCFELNCIKEKKVKWNKEFKAMEKKWKTIYKKENLNLTSVTNTTEIFLLFHCYFQTFSTRSIMIIFSIH